MKYLACTLLILAISYTGKQSSSATEQVVDFAINHKDTTIELPGLYNSLANEIPENDTLIIAKILKSKGFRQTNWGRGNYPPRGPRIVTLELEKEDCLCTVDKIYYFTHEDNVYEIAERITCSQKNQNK